MIVFGRLGVILIQIVLMRHTNMSFTGKMADRLSKAALIVLRTMDLGFPDYLVILNIDYE